MNKLVSLYEKDNRIQEAINEIHKGHTLSLSNTSFDSLFYFHLYQALGRKHVLIFPTPEEAKDFYHDFSLLYHNSDAVLLEPTYIVKNKKIEYSKIKQTQRQQSIHKISKSEEVVVIAYPAACMEMAKLVVSQDLQRNLYKGQKLNLAETIDFMENIGYERTNFVYEHGQYALRGHILDIFSYAYSYPIRIDLFDIDIEEIREFDIETQESITHRQDMLIAPSPSLLQKKKNIEKVPFLNLFSSDDYIWISETLKDNTWTHELETIRSLTENENTEDIIVPNLNSGFNVIKWSLASNNTISPTPIIHKNFNKLYHSILDQVKGGYRIYIMSEDTNQHQRYRAIFEDLGGGIVFDSLDHEFSKGYIDHHHKIVIYTSHEIFARRRRDAATIQTNVSAQTQLLKAIRELVPGDYVTHIDHGVGRFSGLEKIDIGGHTQEAVRLIYANNDILYVHISSIHKISKYVGKEGTEPRMHRLGSDTWENAKRKTKKKIKDIAEDLIKLYAKRKASKGFAFSPDSYLQLELESSFEYEDTPDQAKATLDIKIDMEKEIPMDRLICGDVGFGKTELAIRAAFKAVADSKQVAVLVPTTLLAFQHFHTFSRRLEGLPCNIEFINRFKTTKEKNDILKRLEAGQVDILIGTHAIVGKNVKFKDLGLLIIDEEQKFGVQVKEKLKEFKLNVDTLTLTATPIPRTLQFSLLGARDYSLIQTPPPNRQPVYTELAVFDPEYIREIIQNEIGRGGQVFFVHNKVKDLFQFKEMLMAILPNLDIAMAHGQLEGDVIEQTILDFIEKKYDVLLSTNIIESGIDIPNANTIIVNNAHQFGLSDLHQLRGRVGRSDRKAYCYLLSPPYSTLTSDAKQRLTAMEHNADLGAGFQIAMRDLDLRGAGNLLGGEQSGFISDIGYDTFMKILDEAITELKEIDYKDLYQDERTHEKSYVKECQIETDYDMYIPDAYIQGSQERLQVYTELNQIEHEVKLSQYLKRLKDIYGKHPVQLAYICDAIRLKWAATQLGIERIVLKNGRMRCYLIQNQESNFYQSETFGKLLNYIATYPVGANMKQTAQHMIVEFSNFKNCAEAKDKLLHILSWSGS